MESINIDNCFDVIEKILYGKNEKAKQVMENILKKYSIDTDKFILELARDLTNNTCLFWEPVIKVEYFKDTKKMRDPKASISNYHFLRNPNYTDEYEMDFFGNRESKMIRCANYNNYFIISQKLNGSIDKKLDTLNGEVYDKINILDYFNFILKEDETKDRKNYKDVDSSISFYDFDTYKDQRIKKNITVDTVLRVLPNTFMSLFKQYINDILNEFKEIMDSYIDCRDAQLIKVYEEYDKINEKIKVNEDKLEEYKFPDIEEFNKFVNDFHRNDKVRENYRLPSSDDVVDKIDTFHESRNNLLENGILEEDNFNFEVNENGEKGWTWLLDFNYGFNDEVFFRGEGKYFAKVNPELFELLPRIKDIINNISLKFNEDKDYKDKYYSSKEYDDNLPELHFKEVKCGNIIPIYNDKEIGYDELISILNGLEKLADEVLKCDIKIDINDSSIINFMSDKIECVYNFTDSEDYDIEKEMYNIDNWYNRSYNCDSFRFSSYHNAIINYIHSIKYLFDYSNNNRKKADFFKEYADYCDRLFRGYVLYKENESLYSDRKTIEEKIHSLENDISEYNNSVQLVSTIGDESYQKKKEH